MMQKRVGILCIMVLSFFLGTPEYNSLAAETDVHQKGIYELYEKAISQGKVDDKKYAYAAFKENYELSKKDYETWKNTIGKGLTYDQWFDKIINYGAFPDGEGHSPSEEKTNGLLRGSQTTNGNRLKKAIRKGDILIVKSSSFGHAAIATTNNYILEMTGGGNPSKWIAGGITNNNNQFSKDVWIFGGSSQGVKTKSHIQYWIQLWRLSDNNMASRCANYADATFWNTAHGYKKNRHITYRLTSATTTRDPNYCSKLVFQSFYYGSGSAPVIQPAMADLSFVSPSALPNVFTGRYAPHKVGTY